MHRERGSGIRYTVTGYFGGKSASYPPRQEKPDRDRQENPRAPRIPKADLFGIEKRLQHGFKQTLYAFEQEHQTRGTETNSETHQRRQQKKSTSAPLGDHANAREFSKLSMVLVTVFQE